MISWAPSRMVTRDEVFNLKYPQLLRILVARANDTKDLRQVRLEDQIKPFQKNYFAEYLIFFLIYSLFRFRNTKITDKSRRNTRKIVSKIMMQPRFSRILKDLQPDCMKAYYYSISVAFKLLSLKGLSIPIKLNKVSSSTILNSAIFLSALRKIYRLAGTSTL